MSRSFTALSLSIVLGAAALPSSARAAAMPPPPPPPPPQPGLLVVGTAVLEHARVRVACDTDPFAHRADCEVDATGSLRAVTDVELLPPGPEAELVLLVDGAPLAAPRTLAAGTTLSVEAHATRALAVLTRDESWWLVLPNHARHTLLGQSTQIEREDGAAFASLFEGNALEVSGEITVDDVRAGAVEVAATPAPTGLAVDLRLPAGPGADPIVQSGGPYAGGGFWGPVSGEGGRGELRVGYELSIVEWLIVGLGFETDFDSIAETILVELASPELVVIIPSVSVGVGAVFRQLGPRDADAALRIALGYQYYAMGAYVSFDYWPTIADWTMAAGGRLSF